MILGQGGVALSPSATAIGLAHTSVGRYHEAMGKQIGPYQVLGELGRGAMGVTYRAWSENHRCEVALKLCAAGLASAEESARLVREGQLLAAVDHPFVVGVFDAGEHFGVPYVVMELVEGEDLRQRLRSSGSLEPLAAARLVRQIAEGVAELHRLGIVHRDLKPGNVLLDRRGSPRVCDLGLARGNELTRLTETGALLGTPAFLAPEQATGKQAGPAADVYSLGAMLFELVSGKPPFTGTLMEVLSGHVNAPAPSLSAACPTAPPQLARIVACCLEKDPGDRYRTAAELAAELAEVAHEAPGPHPRSLALIGVGLGAASVLTLAVVWGVTRTAPAPVSSASPPVEQPDDSGVDERLAHAEVAMRAERYQEAREEFAEVFDRDPNNADALAGLGRVAALERRPTTALDLLERALLLDPFQRKALISASVLRAQTGDHDQANAKLQVARRRYGDAPDVEVAAAQLELARGDTEAAQRRLERLVASAPEEADPWFLLGTIHCTSKRYDEGLPALQRAEALDTRPLHAAGYLYQLHRSGADLGEVCDQIDARLAVHPDGVQLLRMQALLRFGSLERDLPRVLEALSKLCAREPMALEPHLSRAAHLFHTQEQLDLAQRDLEFVLEHEPDEAAALELRLGVAKLQGDAYGAWQAAAAQARVKPTDPLALHEHAERAYLAGQLTDFERAAETLWEAFPEERVATFLAGRFLLSGQAASAQRWIERGLREFPTSSYLRGVEACRQHLAQPSPATKHAVTAALELEVLGLDAVTRFALLSVVLPSDDADDQQESLRLGVELEEIGTGDPGVQVLLAELYLTRGRLAQALSVFDRVLGQQPANLAALDGLASVYDVCNGEQEAAGLAQLALELARQRGVTPPERSRTLATKPQLPGKILALSSAELVEQTAAALWAFDHTRGHVLARVLLSREPDNAVAWAALGEVAAQRSLPAVATRCFERALVFAPDDEKSLAKLVRLHCLRRRLAEAAPFLERLRALDPTGLHYCEARVHYVTLEAGGEAALPLARDLAQRFPGEERALLAWALVESNAGSSSEAIAGLRAHLRDDPRGRGWLLLSSTLADGGETAQGADCLQRALGARENQGTVHWQLAELECKANNAAAAIEAAERGLQSDPLNASLWFLLGVCNSELENHGQSREAWLRACGLGKGNVGKEAATLLTILELESGNLVRSKHAARWLLELAPEEANGHAMMLEVARRERDLDAALRHARALLECPDASAEQIELARKILDSR